MTAIHESDSDYSQEQYEHHRRDESFQIKQNSLIERNTRITILLGIIAILAQLLEVIVSLLA